MTTPETSASGLLSIRLHGSFHLFKNKSVLIPCDGATYVGGENGSGKTSLIALLPVFYGQASDKIVSRNANKLSFLDYYLPTTQSMLVFEYRNTHGVQCVVMYRGESAQLCYRFVSGHASSHLFSPEGVQKMQTGISTRELLLWLRKIDIPMSRQIHTITDYRAVIQRSKVLLRRNVHDKDKLRMEAERFGLGSAQNDLTHLEKMSTGMINKDRLMENLKEIIVDSMVRTLHIQAKPDLSQLRQILDDIRVLQEFKRHLPAMQQCILEDKKRLDQEARVSLLNKAVHAALATARETTSSIHRELEDLRTTFEAKEQAHAQTLSALQERKLNTDAQVKHFERRLDSLNNQYDNYQQRGVDEQAKRYQALPSLRAQLNQHEQVLQSLLQLTGKFENVRNDALSALKQALDKQLGQLHQKARSLEAALRKKQEQQSDERLRFSTAQHQAMEQLRKSQSEAVQHLHIELAQLESAATSIGVSAEDMAHLSQLQQAREQARTRVMHAEKALRQVQDELAKNQQQQDQQAGIYRRLLQEKDKSEHERQQLITLLNPKEGSWLALLKEQEPDWANTLGKVIAPELLLRTDLDPEQLEGGSRGIFGWNIRVEHIDMPDFIKSEEAQKARIVELDAWLQSQQQLLEKSQQAAATLQRQRQEFIAHQQQCNVTLEREQENARHASAQCMQAESAIQKGLMEKKSGITQKIQQVQQELTRLQHEQAGAMAQLQDLHRDALMEKQLFWADELQATTDELDAVLSQEQQAKEAHKTRCKAVEDAYKQSLEKDGIDPTKIKTARAVVEQARADIESIVDNEALVHEYLTFMRAEWCLRDPVQEELTAACDQVRVIGAEIAEITRMFQAEKTKLHDRIRHCKITQQELESGIGIAESTLRQVDTQGLNGYCPDSIQEYAHTGLKELCAYLREQLSQVYQTRERVKKSVNTALAVLQTASNASRLAQQYHNRVEQRHQNSVVDPLSDAEKFACVRDLESFITQDLPQMEDAILANFRVQGNALMAYQESVGQLTLAVKHTSRQLKDILNSHQLIKSFKDISVHLSTKVEQEEGWQALKHFGVVWKNTLAEAVPDLTAFAVFKAFENALMSLDNIRVNNEINSMVEMRLSVLESGRLVDLRTTKDIKDVSSTGLSYLLLIVIFMALTRHLCKSDQIQIAWPLDELDNLSGENFGSIIDMLTQHGMYIVTATPDLSPSKKWAFQHKVYFDKGNVNWLTPSVTDTKKYLSQMFTPTEDTGLTQEIMS